MDSQGYCANPPVSANAGKPCQYKYDCPAKQSLTTFAKCDCTFNMKDPRYCDILPGNDPWTLEFANFKKYWNATKNICNSAARWEECGGMELEYTEWQCSKYKAAHFVDYLYKLDGNFSKSLDSCFDKYLKDLPEFKEAESICGRAEKLKQKLLLMQASTGNLLQLSLMILFLVLGLLLLML